MPTEVEPVNTPDGPITPVPVGIRPVMRKHRIEVMNCLRSTWTLELTLFKNMIKTLAESKNNCVL